MVEWILAFSQSGTVDRSLLCDTCGRAMAAKYDLRLPQPHEHGVSKRISRGRLSSYVVTLRRAPSTDEWIARDCDHCQAAPLDAI